MPVRKCERCGATLPSGSPGAAVRCSYCGAEQVSQGAGWFVRLPKHPITPEQIQEELAEQARDERERLRTARIFAAVFVVLALVVVGIALILTR
jgi:hypothetical protein